MEDPSEQTLPPPATLEPPAEPISRPSSTSTQASIAHNLAQLLPSISSLAASASNAATNSPPTSLRNLSPHPVTYSATLTSPASTHPGHGGNLAPVKPSATHITSFDNAMLRKTPPPIGFLLDKKNAGSAYLLCTLSLHVAHTDFRVSPDR
ncbi:hypothetical protein QBC46DRAFT_129585 [Diplogelasinospora grovesii]|uniref:Uncharacterized protein n=1 Tax=Diplogelasinospora grovesii TaxID=303347 RepID=A0AAN6N8G5_9PEZI|nr:hypothetical protein QBC46DRAFT_129585 [Diplogelasinospora grovesii]